MTYTFTSKLWLWEGKDAWTFASLPKNTYSEIKGNIIVKRGFGSVKVQVSVGNSTWPTSIFPDTKRQTYILPIKKSIRLQENISTGDTVRFTVKVFP